MGIASDLKVIYHLAFKRVTGSDHASRMENFYAGQAGDYDAFRKRLLPGRQDLWSRLVDQKPGGVWVDMGGGTGANLEFFGDARENWRKIYIVDLSQSLLNVARQRADKAGWRQVETVRADATSFVPDEGQADVVTFSYSLTMIPDWFAALENADSFLADEGRVGVVDFFVSRKHAADGEESHAWSTRTGWPTWFAMDSVFLSPDHVPFLRRRFKVEHFAGNRTKVPYLPLVRVPFYTFIGKKRTDKD